MEVEEIRAWLGYVRGFTDSQRVQYMSRGTRLIHCKECGVMVPKEIARVKIHGSWSYLSGCYCLECGQKKVQGVIDEKQDFLDMLTKNMIELQAIRNATQETRDTDNYKNIMAPAIMMAKINPRQRERYY